MTKSLTTLGGESEILGGESSPPNSPRINTARDLLCKNRSRVFYQGWGRPHISVVSYLIDF